MLYHNRSREATKRNANKFFVDQNCFDQTTDVLKTRAVPVGIELVIGDYKTAKLDDAYFGLLIQYPAKDGAINNYKAFVDEVKKNEIGVVVATDLLSLALLTPPGFWGADVVVGNSQRFGVPMGFGGPHAAFFACREEFKRVIPGRIIGVSIDASGNPALRMALQTREQHIRRDKATSNICTAQALLAIMASMYAVYHGPHGVKGIAEQVHLSAVAASEELSKMGFKIVNPLFFDTICVQLPNGLKMDRLNGLAVDAGINLNYVDNDTLTIAFDQTVDEDDLTSLLDLFAQLIEKSFGEEVQLENYKSILENSALSRKTPILTHPIFSMYHSESEMMRYIKRLENKDLSLTHSMISLGSCTMKLNAASELYPITWPEFANMHPFAPGDQTLGYKEMIDQLEKDLCEITGFAAMSFQPNSGAQGEYAGLMVIRAYHESRGDHHRNVSLIPSSAHGTNPASAAMCGMNIVVVKCDEKGNIDVADLKEKAEKERVSGGCCMSGTPVSAQHRLPDCHPVGAG
jgi:glycine dehydrogenase